MSLISQKAMLNVICPMHLVIDGKGGIVSAGPTIEKTIGNCHAAAWNFFEIFEIKNPQAQQCCNDLSKLAGQKLRLRLKAEPDLELKGVLMPDEADGMLLLNLSFGINVVRAVQLYDLTAADFAVTDLTVEMLYLVEAKSAAMDAFEALNIKLQRARETAERQASTDALTGLCNRRAMDAEISTLVWSRDPFALMHIDLDYFKSINDTLGHAAGDTALKRVAHVLISETRSNDLVARFGGDEFVVILKDTVDPAGISQIADRIMRSLAEPIMLEGKECQMSASAGTAISSMYSTPDPEAMALHADLALYAAKRDGRGCHRFYHEDMKAIEDAASANVRDQKRA